MVETLKGLVQNMTFSSLANKHDKVGVTETANSNNKINYSRIMCTPGHHRIQTFTHKI